MQQRLWEDSSVALLTCKINYEPAILLLLFLDKGFGLLQALWRAAVTEEEAGETLKHGGEQSNRMDREIELQLNTSFQAQTGEMGREGRKSPRGVSARGVWLPEGSQLSSVQCSGECFTWLQCKGLEKGEKGTAH